MNRVTKKVVFGFVTVLLLMSLCVCLYVFSRAGLQAHSRSSFPLHGSRCQAWPCTIPASLCCPIPPWALCSQTTPPNRTVAGGQSCPHSSLHSQFYISGFVASLDSIDHQVWFAWKTCYGVALESECIWGLLYRCFSQSLSKHVCHNSPGVII